MERKRLALVCFLVALCVIGLADAKGKKKKAKEAKGAKKDASVAPGRVPKGFEEEDYCDTCHNVNKFLLGSVSPHNPEIQKMRLADYPVKNQKVTLAGQVADALENACSQVNIANSKIYKKACQMQIEDFDEKLQDYYVAHGFRLVSEPESENHVEIIDHACNKMIKACAEDQSVEKGPEMVKTKQITPDMPTYTGMTEVSLQQYEEVVVNTYAETRVNYLVFFGDVNNFKKKGKASRAAFEQVQLIAKILVKQNAKTLKVFFMDSGANSHKYAATVSGIPGMMLYQSSAPDPLRPSIRNRYADEVDMREGHANWYQILLDVKSKLQEGVSKQEAHNASTFDETKDEL